MIDADDYLGIPTLPVMFAPLAGDLVWAAAPFDLYSWGAPRNGSYTVDNGFFFATGGLGLALTAGFAAARAAGNSARRRQARADLVERWLPIDAGTVFVSNLGLYLATPGGLHVWGWDSITSIQILQPRQISLTGESANGPIHWLVVSDAAELLFTLWARVRHPAHPQFSSRAWLDRGWFERMASNGEGLPPNLSGRWWTDPSGPIGG